jgi:hypothetical protein
MSPGLNRRRSTRSTGTRQVKLHFFSFLRHGALYLHVQPILQFTGDQRRADHCCERIDGTASNRGADMSPFNGCNA